MHCCSELHDYAVVKEEEGKEVPFQGLWQKRPSLPGVSNQSDSKLLTAGQTFAAVTKKARATGTVKPMPSHIGILPSS